MFDLAIPDAWKAIPGRRHVCEDDEEVTLKRCTCCDTMKPESEFRKDQSAVRAICKKCDAFKTRAWEKENRERRNAYQRERRARLKA